VIKIKIVRELGMVLLGASFIFSILAAPRFHKVFFPEATPSEVLLFAICGMLFGIGLLISTITPKK